MSSSPTASSSSSSSSSSSPSPTTYKFSPERTPDDQVIQAITRLNAFNDTQFTTFMQILLSYLAQDPEAKDQLAVFSSENKINAKTMDDTFNNASFFFSQALRLTLKKDDVYNDLITMGLDSTKAEQAAMSYSKESASLSLGLVDSTFKIGQLVDMEWKFGVTAGTSELSDIGSCFLQIKFVVLKDGEKVSQLVEMTLPQFYSFLSSMQKAANAVEQAQ